MYRLRRTAYRHITTTYGHVPATASAHDLQTTADYAQYMYVYLNNFMHLYRFTDSCRKHKHQCQMAQMSQSRHTPKFPAPPVGLEHVLGGWVTYCTVMDRFVPACCRRRWTHSFVCSIETDCATNETSIVGNRNYTLGSFPIKSVRSASHLIYIRKIKLQSLDSPWTVTKSAKLIEEVANRKSKDFRTCIFNGVAFYWFVYEHNAQYDYDTSLRQRNSYSTVRSLLETLRHIKLCMGIPCICW